MTTTTDAAARAAADALGARTANMPPGANGIGAKPVEEQSVGELVATITRTLSLLVHKEVEQAKADLTASAKRGALGGGALAAAGVIAFFATIFLSVAAALGFHALGLSLGFCFLVVGGAWLLLMLAIAGFGIMALKRAAPDRNPMVSLKADIAALKRSKNGQQA